MPDAPPTIDDASADDLSAATGTKWRLVTDQVMGGVSEARVRRATVAGRPAVHLTGDVNLANNGGFVQTTLDLRPDGGTVDASAWTGIAITVRGNGESYNLHLRTTDVRRPWQSYRQSFGTTGDWRTIRLPFDGFTAHRIDAPLDLSRLRRIGLVAIGREFRADLAVADLRFYA
ncbi:CIA30 family protein [Rhodovibrio sodomensis]|uniref:CIA30 family protein n=1 Tax=Rhodovibrio sodomensis TaxID=1088 RepID=A0ABS1DLC9_9PROT|nr:CIA30 family protein [Rhodovibrio sodomensis]MBK1670308.1 CIA30 family protein [Rhodovibrio sodomensis]